MYRYQNVFIGIGSNLGNPEENCRRGIVALNNIKSVNIIQCSSFYKTEPVGYAKPKQNWFINCVAKVETSLSPEHLLSCLQGLEIKMGRVKSMKWGDRIIDFDILLFDDKIIDKPDLKIPHPLYQERRFVLEPMVEIASGRRHPILKKSIKELNEDIDHENQKIELLKK